VSTDVSEEHFASIFREEAIYFSETSVDTQRTARRYIPEDDSLHNHRCEDLISPASHFKEICSVVFELFYTDAMKAETWQRI
jgi:hypothetical protein